VTAAGVNDPGYNSHSAKKLLRKKKNESWTIRPVVAAVYDRRSNVSLTSPTLGVGGNLL
jgi:hypothetical protein